MKNLSICMIVKNEENVIDRCLSSASKIADEIIVVDTGSSDKTIEIARKFTNHIYSFNWCDDFSAARNFAFEKATGEYLMWIDADDVISKTDIKKILKLKENLTADTYMLKYQIAFDENGKPTFEYFRERIVKNTVQAKFKGFVHEAITPFGQIVYEDIAIQHRKPKDNHDKKRNLKIYNRHIKNGEKLTARETFYYARELYFNGYIKSTIKVLKRYLNMEGKFLPNLIDAYVLLSDCFLFFNDFMNAKKYLIKSFEILPPNAMICCKLARLYVNEKQYEYAIFWYKTALLSDKNLQSGAFVENDYYDFLPYIQLSFCYYQIGNHKKFVKYHNIAKSIKPYDKAVLHNQKFV